jgi:hypothetical protein
MVAVSMRGLINPSAKPVSGQTAALTHRYLYAIGRKNWLFVASVTGGQRAATLYSLIASCKANQVEPWAHLRDIFTRLPAMPTDDPEQFDQLLPDRWLQANPQHRWNIDEIRRQERKKRHQKLRQRRKR